MTNNKKLRLVGVYYSYSSEMSYQTNCDFAYLIGALLSLCEKSALPSLVTNVEQINITGIRQEISPEILDSQTSMNDLEHYFTKFSWAALKKKGDVHVILT